MIVDRVELRDYMSHADTSFAMNGERLVTIAGPIGAGKTALLEAIEYALWDQARGRTDDLVRIGATEMSATVEWRAPDGTAYRAVRGRTRKAGGKTFLEFQRRVDERWEPVVADGGIREVQAAIAKVVGVDGETFERVAFFMQGRVDALARATSGGRMDLLVAILRLDVYPRAEKLTRELARDADAHIAGERARLRRLEEELDRRPTLEAGLAECQRIEGESRTARAAAEATRQATERKLAELDQQLAAAAATEQLVASLEQRVAEQRDRYRNGSARKAAATAAADRARVAIAAAGDARAAAAALPERQAELTRLQGIQRQATELDERIRKERQALDERTSSHRRAVGEWNASYLGARARVDDLTEALAALVPTPCPKCGEPVAPGREDLGRRLVAASAAFAVIEKEKPLEPTSFAIDAGKLQRLESRRRELGYDPQAVIEADRLVRELEREAARAEGLAEAERSLTEALATIAATDQELASIDANGKAIAAELAAAKASLEQLAPLRARRQAVAVELEGSRRSVTTAQDQERTASMAVAAAQAYLEGLDQLDEEAHLIRALVTELEVDAGRLRRLVAAFGDGGIPARIIETVLPEIEQEAQRILDGLVPGATVALRAQRATKDGKGVVNALDILYRDELGERDVRMLSGGERMATSLALSLGLSRIVARRAGARIATVAIDEPDGLDADGRRALGHALRQLAHEGDLERVLVVSHHADLAEAGDAVFQVSKRGRTSVVEQVA